MNDQTRWNAAIRHLSAESKDAAPPADLESTLLREFDRTRRFRRVLPIAVLSLAAAAAVVAALWLRPHPAPATIAISAAPPAASAPSLAPPVPEQNPPAPKPAPVQQARAAEPERPFTPIPYVAPLDPYERVDIVRMDLPVSALIAAGVPVEAEDTGASVQADVLVGQDGRARAVRLVSNIDSRRIE
jgi:hypothetical protein